MNYEQKELRRERGRGKRGGGVQKRVEKDGRGGEEERGEGGGGEWGGEWGGERVEEGGV